MIGFFRFLIFILVILFFWRNRSNLSFDIHIISILTFQPIWIFIIFLFSAIKLVYIILRYVLNFKKYLQFFMNFLIFRVFRFFIFIIYFCIFIYLELSSFIKILFFFIFYLISWIFFKNLLVNLTILIIKYF
jgi:hypothetical protein